MYEMAIGVRNEVGLVLITAAEDKHWGGPRYARTGIDNVIPMPLVYVGCVRAILCELSICLGFC